MPEFCFSFSYTPYQIINRFYPHCPQNTVTRIHSVSTTATWSLTQATVPSDLDYYDFLLMHHLASALSLVESPHHSQMNIFKDKLDLFALCLTWSGITKIQHVLMAAAQVLPIGPTQSVPQLASDFSSYDSTPGSCHAGYMGLLVSLDHVRHISVSGSLPLLFITLGMLLYQMLVYFTFISVRCLLKCSLLREAFPHHLYLK